MPYIYKNGLQYSGSGSGGAGPIDATSTPVANKVSRFDANAFMNSGDMSSTDIEDFIENLNMSGGSGVGGSGGPAVRLIWTNPSGTDSLTALMGESEVTINDYDLTTFDGFLIEFRCFYNDNAVTYDLRLVNSPMWVHTFTTKLLGNTIMIYRRGWWRSAENIHKICFSDCTRVQDAAVDVTGSDTGCLVPLRIWGIKLKSLGGSGSFYTIKKGTGSCGTLAANSYTDFNITFDEPFDTIPTVITDMWSESESPTMGSIELSAINVTEQGFTIRAFNDTSAARSPGYQWVAISYDESSGGSSGGNINVKDMTSQEVNNFINSLDYDSRLLDFFYPVGSYYETSDTTFNPNTTWGGTWVLETEGQVHVSAGENYEVGDAGGEAAVTLTKNTLPNYTIGYMQVPVMGNHAQWSNGGVFAATPSAVLGLSGKSNYVTGTNNAVASGTTAYGWGINTAGGDQAHENMPPYIVVNRWHRTA